MTGLDIGVMGVMAASSLLGLMRGFVREAFSLAAWIAAFLLARTLAPELSPLVPGVESEALRHLVALAVVFLCVLIGVGLAGSVLAGLVKWAGMAAYDKLLGLLFGGLRGVVILLVFTLAAGLTALPKTDFWQDSLLHVRLEEVAMAVQPWLPDDLTKHLRY